MVCLTFDDLTSLEKPFKFRGIMGEHITERFTTRVSYKRKHIMIINEDSASLNVLPYIIASLFGFQKKILTDILYQLGGRHLTYFVRA